MPNIWFVLSDHNRLVRLDVPVPATELRRVERELELFFASAGGRFRSVDRSRTTAASDITGIHEMTRNNWIASAFSRGELSTNGP